MNFTSTNCEEGFRYIAALIKEEGQRSNYWSIGLESGAIIVGNVIFAIGIKTTQKLIQYGYKFISGKLRNNDEDEDEDEEEESLNLDDIKITPDKNNPFRFNLEVPPNSLNLEHV